MWLHWWLVTDSGWWVMFCPILIIYLCPPSLHSRISNVPVLSVSQANHPQSQCGLRNSDNSHRSAVHIQHNVPLAVCDFRLVQQSRSPRTNISVHVDLTATCPSRQSWELGLALWSGALLACTCPTEPRRNSASLRPKPTRPPWTR